MARDLRVDERGKEDGQANQPVSEASVETVAEGELRAEIDRRLARAHEDYRVQLDLYDGRIKRGLLSADVRTAVEAAGSTTLADFRFQAKDDLDRLDSIRREVEARQSELQAFRGANRLSRLPRNPSHTTFRWLFVAVVVLVESGLNGTLFAKGSDTGMIGGVAQASLFACLNVTIAIGYARLGLPLLSHVRLGFRVIGILCLVAYAVFATGLNVSVGHYRDLFIELSGSVPMSDLSVRLITAPFGFRDAQSLLLVILGWVFSIGVVIDVAGLRDPYLGYSEVARGANEATQRYSDRLTSCLMDLKSRRDQGINEMTQVIQAVKGREHDARLAANGRARLTQEYSSCVAHISECHQLLVQRYREANLKARTTDPPRYFLKPMARFTPEGTPSVPEEADTEVMAHVIGRMTHFVSTITAEFEVQVARYRPLSELLDVNNEPTQ